MANGRNRELVVPSSGNLFSELRLRDAEDQQTKVRLAAAVKPIVQSQRRSQTATACMLGINQSKISALVNYRLDGFSVERPLHFLNALGRGVEIVIGKKPGHQDGHGLW